MLRALVAAPILGRLKSLPDCLIFNMTHLLPVFAICLGASVGALARWGLGLWLTPGGLIPWGTLAANLIGGYLIGICIAVFQAMPQLDPVWRLLLITGFLGGLTTFSTFSAEVVGFLMAERYALAMGTATAHVAGSLLMTVAGIKTATYFIASGA
jgi:CrcB protein